jgi:hypothetical protein
MTEAFERATERAEARDAVEGLIIAHDATDKLRYAVAEVPRVTLRRYDVRFYLRPDDDDGGA